MPCARQKSTGSSIQEKSYTPFTFSQRAQPP